MEIQKFNTCEIERVKTLIELNKGNKDLEADFLADIELLKNNTAQYWNSFVLPKNPTKNEVGRMNFIRSMQKHYSSH